MKNKIIKILFEILQALLAIALTLGAWGAGFATRSSVTEIWDWVCVVCGVIILAAITGNILFTVKFRKKFLSGKTVDVDKVYGWALNAKEEYEADLKKAEKRVNRIITLAYVWLAFITAVILTLCFAFGRSSVDAEDAFSGGITLTLISCFIVWGLVAVVITPPSDEPVLKFEIYESDYPVIFGIIRRAAAAVGCDKKIRVTASDAGISVTEYRGCAVINIESVEAAILTDGELYNVMLHEFAHVLNSHSKKRKRLNDFTDNWNDVNSNPISFVAKPLLLSGFGLAAGLAASMLDMLSSRSHEETADRAVRDYGDPQTYANALAKSFLYSRYGSTPRPELDYYYYEPETPAGNYRCREAELFYVYCEKYGSIWKEIMSRELPHRVQSHPLARDRIAATGCEKYDALVRTDNADYLAETRKINEWLDKNTAEEIAANYENIHRTAYLERKELIDAYKRSRESGEPLSDEELSRAAFALRGVDDDLAIEACDEILARYPNDPYANSVKGGVLAARLDPACLDCLNSSMTDPKFTETALDYLWQFASDTGNQQLVDEYRENSAARWQKVIDYDYATSLNRKTKFLPSGLPDEEINEINARVSEICGDRLERAYLCKFGYGENKFKYALIIKLKKGGNGETEDKLCDYMLALNMKRDTVYIDETPKLKKALKKAKINCLPRVNLV